MTRAPEEPSIHEASSAESIMIRQLILDTIELHPTNPFMASFRHEMSEGYLLTEDFVEYAVLVDEKIAARCQINFQPQSDDINAYGTQASELYANEQIATLAGDLVTTAFRGSGLHSKMIKYRLELLPNLDSSYVMCGILVGNDASRDNYLKAGFVPIGEKDISWVEDNNAMASKRVILYGFRLREHGFTC